MIKNNKHTPIGIFVYNRPVHTSRLLESLENCQKLEDCPVFIFSDGPKTESHRENVQIVRKIIHDFAEKHNASIFEESENLGIESSILKGISKICEDHCRFIVLEDDLVLHPRTIDFFLQALDRYEDDVHVNHISGFTFPIRYKPKEDAMILPLFNSWGWATWVRSWNDFEWEPDEAFKEMNKDSGLKNRMYPYYDLFFHHYLQKDMTWDLLWQWKMHSLKRVGVFPSTSLIWCSGFEETATHTASVPRGYQTSYEKVMSGEFPIHFSFPDQNVEDREAEQALRKFLRSMYAHPLRMFYRRMRAIIKVHKIGNLR